MHVDTVLLKVASRCNLDCSYCYVYHMGDESWRDQPKRLPQDTEDHICAELGALRRSQGRPFSVVLHGGEPLLLGARRLDSLLAQLRRNLDVACSLSIQTNGVLVSKAILNVCNAHDATLSVSLDGPPEIHDAARVDRRGQPTHAKVLAGVQALQSHPSAQRLFSGILAVVDPASDPKAIYAYFKALQVPSVDFLYRDGNHTTLPHGKATAESVEYGRWMSTILDCYIRDPAPLRIRLLDDMMKLLLGGQGVKEGVGLTDYGILVIDTDGAIKKNDTLKSTPLGDNFLDQRTVGAGALSALAASAEFEAYHRAQQPTAQACLGCSLLKVCGGGMLTHRFEAKTGYDNPTVFCADQKHLIAQMQAHLAPFILRSAA